MDEHDVNQTAPTETTPAAGTSRRRLFKRLGIATLFGGLAAGLGFKAFASGHGCHGRGGFMSGNLDPATLDERIDRMLKHLSVEIDATPAQQQQLAPILKQAAGDLLPLRTKMRAARTQAKELLTGEHIDRAAIEALRAQQLQQAEFASKRFTQALADAAEVLTPAQRKQLAERMERHRHGWREG